MLIKGIFIPHTHLEEKLYLTNLLDFFPLEILNCVNKHEYVWAA